MTATTAADPAPPHRRPAAPEGPDAAAAERGRTVIGADVVAAIAAHAAAQVAGVRRTAGGTPPGAGRAVSGVRAQARVSGNGGTATLRLRIAVGYPRSVREVTREVRAHTARTVQDLTGMAVRRVDIEIADLVRGGRAH
ncbi:Asp23/Gls24 family envelope stress response protein [Streptomonospora nanhaiensis]|uniref:Asp23/Gls24 family envelope stress response protein n=1 Tax=Streptomonospora nanhaiensis TaxID=1323731 RepID=UPI001C390A09|nr:Asp23/Gls24 family envelope stress response protein [Streptomonospora nanhaiensis]MBV2362653.1 Asp23/Gls24 family envelope stress response protein [Streptomonospora nanhaiensis]MBX9387289.1 Asp23/Gls24 family envelope stress response protein [Streptomonospora nanhaiensis]